MTKHRTDVEILIFTEKALSAFVALENTRLKIGQAVADYRNSLTRNPTDDHAVLSNGRNLVALAEDLAKYAKQYAKNIGLYIKATSRKENHR
jgi:hypothetical protein